ncbi:hypothetical protein CERSUDRAFT_100293 [Gelatoporia subvermispora B]|uniref:Uncharacterized protein n=1 Tax=Ceriporiopsis subvermispora (strain B) TaxID=914234 RepID=M2R051_CERS8|nr:hypothetical protein CERSUDRAFT_100293 [Gelatoporia subvermispora B]
MADTIILALTWGKTWGMVRMARGLNVKAPLMTLILRDGTLYFVGLLSINVLSLVGWATNVFTDAGVFSTPLCSIIITHFLLNLRQLAHGSTDGISRPHSGREGTPDPVDSQTSSLQFGLFVGNMGESLVHGSENDDHKLAWDNNGTGILLDRGNALVGSAHGHLRGQVKDSISPANECMDIELNVV